MLAYEVVTGEPPFNAAANGNMTKDLIQRSKVPLAGRWPLTVSPELADFISQVCMVDISYMAQPMNYSLIGRGIFICGRLFRRTPATAPLLSNSFTIHGSVSTLLAFLMHQRGYLHQYLMHLHQLHETVPKKARNWLLTV